MLRLRLKLFVVIMNYDCILPNFSKSKSHLLCLNLSILFINIEIIEMPKTEPFNQYFEKYETWFTDNRYVYQSELAAVNHFIPKVEKSIEIGIGSGQFALPLKIKTGIDPSKSMIKLAKNKGLNISQVVAENLHSINVKTCPFLWTKMSICKPSSWLSFLFRCLKNGPKPII